MKPRYVKPGEAVAVLPSFMHQDRKGFFWLRGSGPIPNERRGDVAIIHVRGELEHHVDDWGSAESYEGIRRKWGDALSGKDMADAHSREHRWDDDYQPITGTPPKAIMMVIDSPGGVVSGLNETVKAIRKLRAANPGVRTIAYCNEMAASAAYALACSCERIIAPPTAIVGSVGVISTMISQAARNKKEGFDVRLLTSGTRKADGHPDVPLSDSALSAEQSRVDKLALSFFGIVSQARGLSIDAIRGLQAGILLGRDAIKVKLIDEVKSLDDVIATAAVESSGAMAAPGGKGKTMDLKALIKRTKAAIAKEKDPKKIASLGAALASYEQAQAAYKKTEKYVEETTEEEQTSAEEDEAEEEDAAAEEEEEPAETAELPDDDEDDDEEDAKKASKASLAFRAAVEELTGMKGKKALGALRAIAGAHAENTARIRKLEVERREDRKTSLISDAKGKYLTKTEAAWLARQPMATVEGFVEMRRKAGVIVHTDETTLHKPKAATPGTEESLPAETIQIIDSAVAAWRGPDKEAYRKTLVSAHLANHKKAIDAALNGAGRY